ncbi:MAG: glutamyl-tRNA reductase [Chloroflexi bacterium]|nr:glutamyl-tRNA reductase [Chloroflexota bacterium]MBL17119.1 glutamyl-tRNA reductase [Chloroflexota bacterium]MQG10999.1 glutamyl-tRNA reductase [SAR202 cluster bacterium]MQG53878.1 glutamyl-tRNA reductase [SAR202 cluster bacterium]
MPGENLEFLVVGLNHRTAPVEVRERLSLNKEQLPEALSAMNSHGASGVILSTCNRSEFYTLELPEEAASAEAGADRVKQFLVGRFGISLLDVDRYLYVYRGYDCIHHLFRVASSLDSMILGEEQIIGQVRDAYEAATTAGTAQGPLAQLFQQALRVGRRVRRETGISRNALSVSRACVEMAKSVLGDLSSSRVLVVGAGEAGELAAEVLSLSGVTDITVTNRTFQRAEELAASLSAQAITFDGMPKALRESDIVIGCTGSPGYVLEAGLIGDTMAVRPERPLLLIDIAVPRDIDPEAAQVQNVFLNDVDDLESASQASRDKKVEEAEWAEELATDEAQQFRQWCLDLEALPTVIELRDRADQIRSLELHKTVRKLNGKLDAEGLESLDAMTRAIVNKLLHDPTMFLKERKGPEELQIARDIFHLSEEGPKSPD